MVPFRDYPGELLLLIFVLLNINIKFEIMKNLIKSIQEDPSHFNSLYQEHLSHLQNQFPDQDEYWIKYWASRLATLGDPTEVTIRFSNLDDPTTISITIQPDYSS